MSDGGRSQKPEARPPEAAAPAEEPRVVPGAATAKGDRSWPITDPMRQVRAERSAASSQIARSLTAWRKESARQQAAYRVDIPQSGGAALGGDTRAKMEQQLGADLSGVKLHTGSESARAAEGLGARAFTVGQDVHFGAGELRPGTKEGDRLLAHELTHTVQGARSGVQRKPAAPVNDDAGLEREADAMGEHAVSQPHEPAEKEADAVADHAAEAIHGNAAVHGAEAKPASGAPAAKQAAPPIAAKLDEARVFRTVGAAPVTNPAGPAPHAAAVDKELAALKAASTVDAFGAAVAAATNLVHATSRNKVVTRVSRLNASYAKALSAWKKLPPQGGVPAVDAFWNSRIAMLNGVIQAQIAPLADPAAGALKADSEVKPEKQLKAETVFNKAIAATGFKANAIEEAASDATVEESGGIMKCFDVGDFFWKMDPDKRKKWAQTVAGGDEAAAQQQFVAQCNSDKKPPLNPPGKASHPDWKGMTADKLFTAKLNGFVGQAKEAASVNDFKSAISKFQLNEGWYPSQHMFVVSAPADQVKKEMKSGAVTLGKPSIFCHLEFEEFLYQPDDRQYGNLADPKDPNKHSAIKELSCIGFPGDIWASGRYI